MKRLIVLLLATVMVLSLAGCGSNAASGTAKADSAPAEEKKETAAEKTEQDDASKGPAGKLTVFGWGSGAEVDVRKEVTQLYMKKYPEVKVEEVWIPPAEVDKKLDASLAAGNAADVLMMSPDWYGLRSKWFENLAPYMEKDQLKPEEVYALGMFTGYTTPDKKIEGLPITANTFVYAYNKDLFDKAGVAYPTDDWTWDKFAEICQKLTSGDGANKTYGSVNHWSFRSIAPYMYGGQAYNEDWTKMLTDTPEAIKGMQLVGDLINKYKAIPDDAASKSLPADQMFLAGKAGIYPLPGWEANTIAEKVGSNFKWDVALPPQDGNGKSVNMIFATGFAINKDSKVKDLAWTYVQFSSVDEEAAKANVKIATPVNKKVAEEVYSIMTLTNSSVSAKKYVEAYADGFINPWGGALSKASDELTRGWEKITLKGEDAAATMKEYTPKIQKILDEMHAKK